MTDDLKVRPGETLGDYSRRRGLCLPEEMRVALYVRNGGPMPNGWALPLGAREAHRCQGNSVRCLACERAAPPPKEAPPVRPGNLVLSDSPFGRILQVKKLRRIGALTSAGATALIGFDPAMSCSDHDESVPGDDTRECPKCGFWTTREPEPAPPRSVSELPSPDREIVCKWLRALHEIADIVGVPPGESITDSVEFVRKLKAERDRLRIWKLANTSPSDRRPPEASPPQPTKKYPAALGRDRWLCEAYDKAEKTPPHVGEGLLAWGKRLGIDLTVDYRVLDAFKDVYQTHDAVSPPAEPTKPDPRHKGILWQSEWITPKPVGDPAPDRRGPTCWNCCDRPITSPPGAEPLCGVCGSQGNTLAPARARGEQ